MGTMLRYLIALEKEGALGRGREIEFDLPLDLIGTLDFLQTFVRKTALREGVGDILSSGLARTAEKSGRYKKDTDSGMLNPPPTPMRALTRSAGEGPGERTLAASPGSPIIHLEVIRARTNSVSQ